MKHYSYYTPLMPYINCVLTLICNTILIFICGSPHVTVQFWYYKFHYSYKLCYHSQQSFI